MRGFAELISLKLSAVVLPIFWWWWFRLPVAIKHSIKITGAIVGSGEIGYRFEEMCLSEKKLGDVITPFREIPAAGSTEVACCWADSETLVPRLVMAQSPLPT